MNIIVTKVGDNDCDICKHMSRFDSSVVGEFKDVGYQETTLDEVIDHQGNSTRFRLNQCIDHYCLNPDYTVDLPVYVFLKRDGKFLGHIKGTKTLTEFRSGVKTILSEIKPEAP